MRDHLAGRSRYPEGIEAENRSPRVTIPLMQGPYKPVASFPCKKFAIGSLRRSKGRHSGPPKYFCPSKQLGSRMWGAEFPQANQVVGSQATDQGVALPVT